MSVQIMVNGKCNVMVIPSYKVSNRVNSVNSCKYRNETKQKVFEMNTLNGCDTEYQVDIMHYSKAIVILDMYCIKLRASRQLCTQMLLLQ